MADDVRSLIRLPTGMVPPQKPYVYAEYPKWITTPDGKRMIVDNAEQEAREMGEPSAPSLVWPAKRSAE